MYVCVVSFVHVFIVALFMCCYCFSVFFVAICCSRFCFISVFMLFYVLFHFVSVLCVLGCFSCCFCAKCPNLFISWRSAPNHAVGSEDPWRS